jgi:hypothetical protein
MEATLINLASQRLIQNQAVRWNGGERKDCVCSVCGGCGGGGKGNWGWGGVVCVCVRACARVCVEEEVWSNK